MPVDWFNRSFNGSHKSNLIAEPGISIKMEPTANWSLGMSYAYLWTALGLTDIVGHPVFVNYITMREGTGQMENTMSHSISESLAYKNPVKGLFASFNATWMNLKDNILYESNLKMAYITAAQPTSVRTRTY